MNVDKKVSYTLSKNIISYFLFFFYDPDIFFVRFTPLFTAIYFSEQQLYIQMEIYWPVEESA